MGRFKFGILKFLTVKQNLVGEFAFGASVKANRIDLGGFTKRKRSSELYQAKIEELYIVWSLVFDFSKFRVFVHTVDFPAVLFLEADLEQVVATPGTDPRLGEVNAFNSSLLLVDRLKNSLIRT